MSPRRQLRNTSMRARMRRGIYKTTFAEQIAVFEAHIVAAMDLLTVPLLLLFLALVPRPGWTCDGTVEPLNITEGEACTNVSTHLDCGQFYPLSFFPNSEAANQLQASNIIFSYLHSDTNRNCSPYITLHVCLAVQPICETDVASGATRVRPPCRDLCWQVAAACSHLVGEGIGDVNCLFACNRWPETDCVGLNDPLVTSNVPTPSPSAPHPSPAPSPTSTVTVDDPLSSCPSESQSYFTEGAKSFAKGWVAFWSVLCYLSTLVTLLTFFLDTSRFQYPWRPVVYLSLSFHIHTLGYFLAFIIGPDSVTCPGGEYVQTDTEWTWLHTPCILVFGLLYYSMVAAFLWWFILTLSWLLSSAYKWTNEAISQFSLFYHTAAWVIPLILTVSVLASKVVSADELTGTCFIVRTDSHASFLALLLGLILPLSLCLLVGSGFVCIGFINLLQIRRFMVHRGKERESIILEKLMVRIGVYVAIYILPAAILIGCFIYELDTRPDWHTVDDPCTHCSRPSTAAFMVRVFMFLLIGALTGVWIWSRKTLDSWKKLPVKLRACVFPVTTSERTQDAENAVNRLNSFTSPPLHLPVKATPSYPYSVDSGNE